MELVKQLQFAEDLSSCLLTLQRPAGPGASVHQDCSKVLEDLRRYKTHEGIRIYCERPTVVLSRIVIKPGDADVHAWRNYMMLLDLAYGDHEQSVN